MSNKGWIKLHRQIQDCDIWFTDSPFDERSAWIDLLLLANHSDKQIVFDGKLVVVERGQYMTSVRKLAVKWGWGNQKTLKYLRLLEELGMIEKDSDSRRTLITIVNYEVYQDTENADRTQIDTLTEHSQNADRTQTERKSTTNKNVKNDKNKKNDKNVKNEKNIFTVHTDEIKEIIDYLNMVVGTKFTYTNKQNNSLINARLEEGFTVDDFKTVIDKKASQWKADPKMSQFLRPLTLFAPSKFEAYLNEISVRQGTEKTFDVASSWLAGRNSEC